MAKVSAAYLGTATACLLFLLIVDRVNMRAERPVTLVDAVGHQALQQQNYDLRQEWWKMRADLVDAELLAGTAIADAVDAKLRLNAAESKLASVEAQLVTAKSLADAGRREHTRIPLLGDDEADRIPPQNVPVPVHAPGKE